MNPKPLFIPDPAVTEYPAFSELVFEFTANPVQKDHVKLVDIAVSFIESVQRKTRLHITIIPVFMHPYEHKNKQLIDFSHRLNMTQEAFAELEKELKKRGHTLNVVDATSFMGTSWFSNQLVEKLHE